MYYNYEIINTSETEYKFIIFSTSIETPLKDVHDICYSIRSQYPHECKILFDMLLNMGNTSERFAEATFDGQCIVPNSVQYVKIEKRSTLRSFGAEFLNRNTPLLEQSILNSVQKRMLMRGIAI